MTTELGSKVAMAALLTAAALSMLALATLGWTYTWDTESEFEEGTHDGTVWDDEADGVTMHGTNMFWKHRSNPLISEGTGGAWDDSSVGSPSIVFARGQYHLYYTGNDGSDDAIGLARGSDGVSFGKVGSSAVLSKGSSGTYDSDGCSDPSVLYEDGVFKMWYTAQNTSGKRTIAYATSTDGTTWTKHASNPVIDQPTGVGVWGSNQFGEPCVIKVSGKYWMYLSGSAVLNSKTVGLAKSEDGVTWSLHKSNPVLGKASFGFGTQETCDVAVTKDDAIWRMYFTGRNNAGVKYKIGYAWSYNGYDWDRAKEVYLKVGNVFDTSQLQSPGVMWDGDTMLLYYHGDDGSNVHGIGLAEWKPWLRKSGPPVNPILGTGSSTDSKHLQDPSVFLTPSGSYQMYYGAYGGSGTYPYAICAASSNDGVSWSKYIVSTTVTPVISPGTGTWDEDGCYSPCGMYDKSKYRVWYAGKDGTQYLIGYAEGSSATSLTKYGSNPVLSNGSSDAWDGGSVMDPWVLLIGDTYHMWYVGYGYGYKIGHATSSDGISWTKDGNNPVFEPEEGSDWEGTHVRQPCVIHQNGRYVMYYSGFTNGGYGFRIGVAYSSDGVHWTRDEQSPHMDLGNSTTWTDGGVWTGSVLVEGVMHRVYFAGYNGSSYQIGYGEFDADRSWYTTDVLDASAVWPVKWGTLSWEATTPLGTILRFQVATNQGGTVWNFVGPDGTHDTYFTDPGQGTYALQSGKYLRVRAYFQTENSTKFVPCLHSITVTYNQRDAPAPPEVEVTSPNGGEDWMKTKTYPITWTAVGNMGTNGISIDYSLDNGTTWTSITTGTDNSGVYRWTVPSQETSGALVRVTAFDMDGMIAFDTSDATFAIDPPAPKEGAFASPAAGESLPPGKHVARWSIEDPWGLAELPLTLELTTDGGLTWRTLEEGFPLTGSLEWAVPELPASSGGCALRLSVLSWLGDVSLIESPTFSIDTEAPSIDLGQVPSTLDAGEETTVQATVTDDLGVGSVSLHVSGPEGVDELVFPMVRDAGGDTWTAMFVPEEGQTLLWVTAQDGCNQAASASRGFSVGSTTGSEGASSSLVGELAIAAMAAIAVLGALALAVSRREGRG